MPDTHGYGDDETLLVGPAAQLVGVHPDTLRRWAAAGRVPVLRTPTNQRRFRVRDLRRLVVPEQHDETQAPDGDEEGDLVAGSRARGAA